MGTLKKEQLVGRNILFLIICLLFNGCSDNKNLKDLFERNCEYFQNSALELSRLNNGATTYYNSGNIKNLLDTINVPKTKMLEQQYKLDIIDTDENGNIYYRYLKEASLNNTQDILIYINKKPLLKNVKLNTIISKNWMVGNIHDYKY